MSARRKLTSDTSISICRAQTERHLARILDSALNLKTTAFGQEDRAALGQDDRECGTAVERVVARPLEPVEAQDDRVRVSGAIDLLE